MLRDQGVTVTWVLGLLMIATVAGMLALVRQWQRGALAIARRQLGFRLLGGAALLAVWAMLAMMLLFLDPQRHKAAFIACFVTCGVLCLLLAALALVDIRLVALQRLRAEAKLAGDLARNMRGG